MNRQKVRLTMAVVMVFLFPVIYYYLSPYLIIMGATRALDLGQMVPLLLG